MHTAGIATVLLLASASPSPTADDPILAQVLALCAPNHAEPGAVLAAADAAGWQGADHPLGGFFDGIFDGWRDRSFDSRDLSLVVKSQVETRPIGQVKVSACTVMSSSPGGPTMHAALTAHFGKPPTAVQEPIEFWSWAPDPATGEPHFLPARASAVEEALTEGPVVMMMTDVGWRSQNVRYIELALEGLAAPARVVGLAHDAMERGDHAVSMRLLARAFELGEPAGAYNLGLYYDQGLGVPRDPALARGWMEKAAAMNHPAAKTWLEKHSG